jgi:hypothetical protein
MIRPQTLAWLVAAFGFLGVYMLPVVKYPANPPAIGHDFTIGTRGQLYLTTVAGSLILLGLAVLAARRLRASLRLLGAVLVSAAGFFVGYGVLMRSCLPWATSPPT